MDSSKGPKQVQKYMFGQLRAPNSYKNNCLGTPGSQTATKIIVWAPSGESISMYINIDGFPQGPQTVTKIIVWAPQSPKQLQI